VLNKHLINCLC